MEEIEIIFFALLAVVINAAILFLVICFAVRIKRQLWNQKQQIILLMKIAKQLGVPSDKETENIAEGIKHNMDEYIRLSDTTRY